MAPVASIVTLSTTTDGAASWTVTVRSTGVAIITCCICAVQYTVQYIDRRVSVNCVAPYSTGLSASTISEQTAPSSSYVSPNVTVTEADPVRVIVGGVVSVTSTIWRAVPMLSEGSITLHCTISYQHHDTVTLLAPDVVCTFPVALCVTVYGPPDASVWIANIDTSRGTCCLHCYVVYITCAGYTVTVLTRRVSVQLVAPYSGFCHPRWVTHISEEGAVCSDIVDADKPATVGMLTLTHGSIHHDSKPAQIQGDIGGVVSVTIVPQYLCI